MPGVNCRALCVLRGPRILFPGRILSARSQLWATLCSSRSQNTTPRPHFDCPQRTVGHFVLFAFPGHHSQATSSMSRANCTPLRDLCVPRVSKSHAVRGIGATPFVTLDPLFKEFRSRRPAMPSSKGRPWGHCTADLKLRTVSPSPPFPSSGRG